MINSACDGKQEVHRRENSQGKPSAVLSCSSDRRWGGHVTQGRESTCIKARSVEEVLGIQGAADPNLQEWVSCERGGAGMEGDRIQGPHPLRQGVRVHPVSYMEPGSLGPGQ